VPVITRRPGILALALLLAGVGCTSRIGTTENWRGPDIWAGDITLPTPPPTLQALRAAALGRTLDPPGATAPEWLEGARAYAARYRLRHFPSDAVAAAAMAWRSLRSRAEADAATAPAATAIYNEALGGLMEHWPRTRSGDLADTDVAEAATDTPILIDWARSDFSAGSFEEWTPADDFDIAGFRHRYVAPGLGIPLVGFHRNLHRTPEEDYEPVPGITRCATALLEAEPGRGVHLRLLDPAQHPTFRLGGRERALAADRTAPLARLIDKDDLAGEALRGFTNLAKFGRKPGLVLLEPYDPRRVPVVLVHGLRSSPLIWRDLTNQILGEPDLRARLQVWVYFYPTAVPALVSSDDLRSQLRAARALFSRPGQPPALNDLVLVGHSMGGLVCRPLVTESGEALWKAVIREQPGAAAAQPGPLSAHDEALHRLLVFHPEPYVRRVIFIATPHRGSAWADNWLGRLVGGQISIPDDFSEAWKEVISLNPQEMNPFLAQNARGRNLNSVRALSPHNPVLLALADLPVAPGIPFHTITGDRGRGDGAKASDGVVTYASSHLTGAASECVVPAGHFLTNEPACTDEVIRILRLQLALEGR
jgi:hypothetical protein